MEQTKIHIINSIKTDFSKYLDFKDRANTTDTKKRYIDDLEVYIDEHLELRSLVEDYTDIFNKSDIKAFLTLRKSATAKFALSNLLSFYHYNKRVSDSFYLEIKNELKKYRAKKLKDMDFLSDKDFEFLFSSALDSEEYEIEKSDIQLLRLILLITYNYTYEQTHIFNLKWGDIDLSNKTIRNLRFNKAGLNQEKFEINEEIYELIVSLFGLSKKKESEYVFENLKHNKNSINNLLGILNGRQKNHLKLSSKVNLQKIIRSRILSDLIKSEGKALINFYKIFGLTKNTQLTTAIKEYLVLEKSKMANDI
ncbi:hypothetical protein PAT3040_02519 [Paenibacillus agaridevorans]|uniref:Integrase n=1 Tax=Paenibacillus agaridevorans TaxID=171404 RepID=A0A2R5EX59_9BACL|nr:hypothetical protein [Paenibacillus agaridevorans]GBG07954.1 hypothetical protein PAT3040_02519 [Paenibacillus agaridevorans]